MKLGIHCETCPLRDRTGPVQPDGNPQTARLVFIGEGPGPDEIREGRGFVGAAGWELWRLAEVAGIERRDCVVLNVVRCLPAGADHGDYKLGQEEIDKCSNYMWEIIDKCRKDAILVPLGATALKATTGEPSIKRWRGAVLRARR